MSKRKVVTKEVCTIDPRVADHYLNQGYGSIAESMAAAKAFREAQNHQHDLSVVTQKVNPKKKRAS